MSLLNIMTTIEKNHKKEDWTHISKEQNLYFYQNFPKIKELYLEETSSNTLLNSSEQSREISSDNINNHLFLSESLSKTDSPSLNNFCNVSAIMDTPSIKLESEKKDILKSQRKMLRKAIVHNNIRKRHAAKKRATSNVRSGK